MQGLGVEPDLELAPSRRAWKRWLRVRNEMFGSKTGGESKECCVCVSAHDVIQSSLFPLPHTHAHRTAIGIHP